MAAYCRRNQRIVVISILVLTIFLLLFLVYLTPTKSHLTPINKTSDNIISTNTSSITVNGYPLSKDVVIYSVHYDDRSRIGKDGQRPAHNTTVVFLLEIKVEMLNDYNNLITKCGSDRQTTTSFIVRKDRETILQLEYRRANHRKP